MSLTTLIIGSRGQGKSTFIKKMIKDKYNYVFDVQNEYAEEFNAANHLNREQFIKECVGYTDTYCVFEEATGFFKERLSLDTDRMLLGARHTRNRYIFCFHNIRAVPPQIYLMMNFVVLFKTPDDPKFIKTKYPELFRPCIELKSAKDYTYKIIKIS